MDDILMPRITETMRDGVLLRWLAPDGAAVVEGQLIAEVAVEDRVEALEAPSTGELLHGVAEGTEVGIGDPIGMVGAAAPAAPVQMGMFGGEEPGGPAAPVVSTTARRIAEELGVDLSTVTGTGPGGRIVRADVEAAAAGAPPPPAPQPESPQEDEDADAADTRPSPLLAMDIEPAWAGFGPADAVPEAGPAPVDAEPEDEPEADPVPAAHAEAPPDDATEANPAPEPEPEHETEPVAPPAPSALRLVPDPEPEPDPAPEPEPPAVAAGDPEPGEAALPAVLLERDVDVTELLRLRDALAAASDGPGPGLDALLVRAIALSGGDGTVAVVSPGEPEPIVIPDADGLSVGAIAAAILDGGMAGAAAITLLDLSSGGADRAVPAPGPGTVLAVGRVRPQPVVRETSVVAGRVVTLTLTPAASDGWRAGTLLLERVAELLERPHALVL